MNKEYLKYATEMSTIGDRIIKISNNVGRKNILEAKTKEELKIIYSEIDTSAKQFENCLNELQHISPPTDIKDEHMKIIDGVKKLVKGAKLLSKAIDIDNGSANVEDIITGFKLYNEAEQIVKKEVEVICNKFGI